eukprot:sb/3466305/
MFLVCQLSHRAVGPVCLCDLQREHHWTREWVQSARIPVPCDMLRLYQVHTTPSVSNVQIAPHVWMGCPSQSIPTQTSSVWHATTRVISLPTPYLVFSCLAPPTPSERTVPPYRKFAYQCAACSKLIISEDGAETYRIIAMDKDFHVSCYKCMVCDTKFSNEEGAGCYPFEEKLLLREQRSEHWPDSYQVDRRRARLRSILTYRLQWIDKDGVDSGGSSIIFPHHYGVNSGQLARCRVYGPRTRNRALNLELVARFTHKISAGKRYFGINMTKSQSSRVGTFLKLVSDYPVCDTKFSNEEGAGCYPFEEKLLCHAHFKELSTAQETIHASNISRVGCGKLGLEFWI